MVKAVARIAIPLLIVAVIFLGVLPQFIEPGSLRKAWERLSALEWILLVAVALARIPLAGWQHRAALPGLSLWRATRAYLAAAAVGNVIPGPAGMATRYGMYRSWGFTPEDTSLAVFISGLPTTIVSLLLPIVAIILLAIYGGLTTGTLIVAAVGAAAAVAGIVTGAAVLRSQAVAIAVGERADAIVEGVRARIGRGPDLQLADRLPELRANARRLVGSRRWVLMGSGLALRLSEFFLLLLCLRFVGVDSDELPAAFVFVVYALMGLVTLIQITPGAAGIAELGYAGLLSVAVGGGFDDEIAAAVFVFRGGTWLLPILLGAPVLLIWRRRARAP